jgi:hypothetical protein
MIQADIYFWSEKIIDWLKFSALLIMYPPCCCSMLDRIFPAHSSINVYRAVNMCTPNQHMHAQLAGLAHKNSFSLSVDRNVKKSKCQASTI